MGAIGRLVCIFTPMLCTLASMVALGLLLVSGTSKNIMPSIYYIKLDVRRINMQAAIDLVPGPVSIKVPTNITSLSAAELGLNDFYVSYLWNYCTGNVDGDKWPLERCNKSSIGYSFNVEAILNAENKKHQNIDFPGSVKKVQKAINVVSKFMAACYVLAGIATAVTFLVGWFGLLSRWGSCVTTIFASVAFGFLFTASACISALTYSLKGAFNTAFDTFGVEATVGQVWISATWAATVFSFAAFIFWMMSTCCCSGRTSRVMGRADSQGKRSMKVERTPYTYERVASPYMGQSAAASGQPVPMQPYGAQVKPGYEPMRHGKV